MNTTSFSARDTFYFWQKAVIGLLLSGCLVGLFTIGTRALILPLFLYVVLTVILCTHILYLVLLSSIRSVDQHSIIDLITSNKDDAPLYTVLVPLYQESEILPKLIENLLKLDYPTDRLEIILLLEEDDEKTRATVENLQLPSHFQATIVPPAGLPRTKARACNFGLEKAHGEFLVIYDAEDQPDPKQLWKAVTAFQQSDDTVACVQSRLSFYNPRQNLLTRLFTLEYTFWFDLFLPALSIIGAPIPLGGSSNHLRTSRLWEIGGWDAYNVTEDCDLGIRLAKAHHRTIIINSTTMEEANSQIGNWIRQRSRWIKGYFQTYLVHTRDKDLLRKLGLQNFLFFQLYIGITPLLLLLAPLFWMVTLVWNLGQGHILGWYFPPVLYLLSLASFVLSVLALLSCGLSSAVARRNYDLIKDLSFFPFYIFIFYIAAWKGCFQLFTRPHYWEKTKHGLG